MFFFLLNGSLCLGIDYFVNPESTVSTHPTSVFSLLLIVLIISILYTNCYFLSSVKCSDLFLIKVKAFIISRFQQMYFLKIIYILLLNFCKQVKKGSKMRVFQIGTLLHIISFAGSSFVEEEHQTWYFFWGSTVACLLYRCSGKWFAYHRQ